MRQKGAAGFVWDAATLDGFIADPKSVVAGTSMSAPPGVVRDFVLMTLPRGAVDQPTITGRFRLAPDSIQATISL